MAPQKMLQIRVELLKRPTSHLTGRSNGRGGAGLKWGQGFTGGRPTIQSSSSSSATHPLAEPLDSCGT